MPHRGGAPTLSNADNALSDQDIKDIVETTEGVIRPYRILIAIVSIKCN